MGELTPGRGYNREEVEAGAETINVYSVAVTRGNG